MLNKLRIFRCISGIIFVSILIIVISLILYSEQHILITNILISNNSHAQHKSSKCFFTKLFTKSPHIFLDSSELIPQPSFLLAAHSATLTTLPNGDLLALWFAGSHEGKSDVKIWQSRWHNGIWSDAIAVISPEIISHVTGRYTRKVGNPVVYLAANGKLYLFVVSVSIGGWSGSSLNEFISDDFGKTWGQGRRLILSPFLNLSTLCRTNPITLVDGGFYLPVYHEFFRTYPEILRFDKNGNFIRQIRLTSHSDLLQPALLPVSNTGLSAYMRNNDRQDNKLYYQMSNDAGLHWAQVMPTNLTNPDSSIVVGRINNNTYVMIHNNKNRNKLSLAISNDGISWHDIYTLENTPMAEFSYPAIVIHNDIIDVLYTWKRLAIKHVRLSYCGN